MSEVKTDSSSMSGGTNGGAATRAARKPELKRPAVKMERLFLMSNEQSIRDELIGLRLASYSKIMSDGYPSGIIRGNEDAADILLASPVIRRIQAEALREAADSIERRRNEPGLVKLDVQCAGYYTGIRSGMESSVKALRSEADRIERGETA